MERQAVVVTVQATDQGVGKTVVAAIIREALKRARYECRIEPVPHPCLVGTPAAERWTAEELLQVERLGRHLLDDPDRSHPRALVVLVVHG